MNEGDSTASLEQFNLTEPTALLLSAFLQEPLEWRYGYELAKDVSLSSGTLYPILRRLHAAGVLERHWVSEDVDGPRRRNYRLTTSGSAFARTYVSEFERRATDAEVKTRPAFPRAWAST